MVDFAFCLAIFILIRFFFPENLTYRLLLCYLFIYLICFIVCWVLVAVVSITADKCRYASYRFMAISTLAYSFGFALGNANYSELILTLCRNENVLFKCCRCRIFSNNWQLVMGKFQSTKEWYCYINLSNSRYSYKFYYQMLFRHVIHGCVCVCLWHGAFVKDCDIVYTSTLILRDTPRNLCCFFFFFIFFVVVSIHSL